MIVFVYTLLVHDGYRKQGYLVILYQSLDKLMMVCSWLKVVVLLVRQGIKAKRSIESYLHGR